MTSDHPIAWGRVLAVTAALGVALGALSGLDPDNVLGVALSGLWGAVLFLIMGKLGRDSLKDPWLARAALAGIVLRAPLALAHLVVAYVAFGNAVDMFSYFQAARDLAESAFAAKGEAVGPGLFEMDFSRGVQGLGWDLIDRIYAIGYFAFGPSVGAMLFMCGIFGFFGSYLFLRAYQVTFGKPRDIRLFALLAFFSPSLAFWTGLLGKDSLMFLGLGLAAYGVANLAAAWKVRYVIPLAIGLGLILLIRSPTLFAVGGGAGVAIILSLRYRLWTTGPAVVLRPFGYAVALTVVLSSAFTVIQPLRAYMVDVELGGNQEASLADGLMQAAVARHVGLATDETTSTGSSIAVSVTEATVESSLAYLPYGMFTFLFRPLIFEAHNTVALVAAIDGTALMALVIWRRRSLWRSLRAFVSVPFVAFCWISFFLLTAGLAFETNFGAIVRHRAMVLGFFYVLLAFPVSRTGGQTSGPDADGSEAELLKNQKVDP